MIEIRKSLITDYEEIAKMDYDEYIYHSKIRPEIFDAKNYKKLERADFEQRIENADKIQLPYTTKQRVVIFGGHATWLKAIKPMLPNVKFIDPYTKPDANLIRHADVVWMQTNAMPHSFYGKIMEIVRQRKIPVKYFAYASADKCAKQLAEDDMKIDIDQ